MPRKRELTRWLSVVLLSVTVLLSGCGRTDPMKEVDTPTTGKIKVGIDESYRLLMDAQIYAFESLYTYAKLDTFYSNEVDILNGFLKDSFPVIITNRKLTASEENFLKGQQIIPKTTRIAYDAVALIVNRENPDSNLYFETIRDIFTGKITNWNQIDPKSKLGDIKVLFDSYKSSNPRYFKEKFKLDKLPDNCFAQNGNNDVINSVERNKNAIGIVSVNWISDREDSVSNNFLKKITVVGVSNEGNNFPSATFYQPYQAYIAQGDYPFTREVYCINRQYYTGLGYGLSAFIAGEKGQLILLHSGLVPATMPVRIVQIKH